MTDSKNSGDTINLNDPNSILISAQGVSPDTKLSEIAGGTITLEPKNPVANASQNLSTAERIERTMMIDGKYVVRPIQLLDGFVFTNSKGKDINANGVMAYKKDEKWYLARGTYSGKGTEVNTVFGKYEWCKEQWDKMTSYVKTPITWRESETEIETKES